MAKFKTIGPIISTDGGYSSPEQHARAFLKGFDFSEEDAVEDEIKYASYVDQYGDIVLWYDYGADYYFFALAR